MNEKSQRPKPPQSRAAKTEVSREIDENLKRVYQETLKEQVPDRFAQLLMQLREKEGKL